MKITFLSLYDDQIKSFFERGIIKRAVEDNVFKVDYLNFRSFSKPPHYSVDDYPFSDRRGMLLRYDVVDKALCSLPKNVELICPDPKGPCFNYKDAKRLSEKKSIAFICPAYEGIDNRIFEKHSIQRYSVGDIILPTGDSAAIMMAEAIARFLSGVVGCSDCIENDSILSGLLEYPQYTVPRSIDNMDVPSVLLSGNHKKIDQWKTLFQIRQTLYQRPDLINEFKFNKKLVTMIDQVIMEDIK